MSKKGRRCGLKRLEVWLPVDHAVWSLPPGDRARAVREWLDLGARIGALEEAMARMERKLGKAPDEPEQKPPAIDPEAFLDI